MYEPHGSSQEGFRNLRCMQRQVLSLQWAIEDRAEKKGKLYLSYTDLDTAS